MTISSLQQCYDQEIDYFNLKKSVMNVFNSNSYLNDIVKIPFLYRKYKYDKLEAERFLKVNFQSSFIDGLIFLKQNKEIYNYKNFYYLSKVINSLEESNICIEDLSDFYSNKYEDDVEDIFLKQSSAWYEVKGISDYRVLQDLFYDDPNSAYLNLEIEGSKLSSEIELIVKKHDLLSLLNSSISEITETSSFKKLMNKGAITRTSIFNYIIALKKGDVYFSEDTLYWIMGNTRDLPGTVNYKLLRKLAKKTASLECKIIYFLLINKKSKSELDNHQLRKFLETTVIDRFDEDIVKFVDYQSTKSISVAYFTYATCTEDFIAKLTHITKDTVQITETRARLHTWMGEKNNDRAYIERARTLRIDHKINKIRNEIDDYRIYVDAQRFNEWISDEILLEFTSILINLEKSGLTQYYDSPQLLFLIEKVYKEFCNNNIYGISSYLGRRIRHGTFKGVMFHNVISSMESRFKSDIERQRNKIAWEEWKIKYEYLIDNIILSYLHVESDKNPMGLIKPSIKSSEKQEIAKVCIQDLMNSFFIHGSQMQLNNFLIEYCWRLIANDLKNINSFLKNEQINVMDSTKPIKVNNNYNFSSAFHSELQKIVREKFSIVFEWFKRPQSVAPKAEIGLLLKAVIGEVKETFGDLKYDEDQLVSEYELFGGAYHVIYDALFVIVFNAAKHGSSNKELEISLDYNEVNKKFIISIFSYIKDGEKEKDVNKSLELPKDADISNAQLHEGRSGILKLYHLKQYDNNFNIEKMVCEDAKVKVIISYKVSHNV